MTKLLICEILNALRFSRSGADTLHGVEKAVEMVPSRSVQFASLNQVSLVSPVRRVVHATTHSTDLARPAFGAQSNQ